MAAGIPSPEKYDVFLSFRGEDIRNTFTSHLHAALLRKKVETYIDYRLERGDEIGPSLLEAIEKSKLSVVIFSKEYASSTWCLDELVHIQDCKGRRGQIVIPIFYDIDPSQVQKQQGSYADSFAQLEKRFKDSMHKVLKWRDALEKVAKVAGFDNSNKARPESHLVEAIVKDILTKLNRKSSSDLKGLVGIESRIEQIESLMCIDSLDVCTVGIWGMGGIGKTTLAGVVFNRLSSRFEVCCFLANVREESEKHGLNHLRNKLLSVLLEEESIDIGTPFIGSTFVRQRLCCTKAFIVLDDVNDASQLELLVGDHVRFGPGSRIIITTRDGRLLKKMVDDDKIYKVKGLNCYEALELFHLNAFGNFSPRGDYAEVTAAAVDYAVGIPLALKILGSSFLQCKSKEDWEDVWKKLKQFPSKKIQNVLRLSYDGLEENEKEIFLDIACFYKGMHIDSAKRMLDIRGFFAAGIGILIDMSLISISSMNYVEMHDLLQEMGREIVREQCIEDPGKRNRLCIAEDVYHVLKNNTGTGTVQCLFFNTCMIRELHLSSAAFKNMYNLRLLKVYNSSNDEKKCKLYLSKGLQSLPDALSYLYWEGYPLKSLPSKFSPENVLELRLPRSQVKLLWNKDQDLGNLKLIDLSFSRLLIGVPDLSRSRKLGHINLHCCTSLVQIPSYFQYFDKLTHLELGSCSNLKYLPEMPGNIEFLNLSRTAIEELPSSVWSHEKISYLDIRFCRDLNNLPSSNCKLKGPFSFTLVGCSSLGKFLELPRNVRLLDLTGTAIEVLPSSIECCSSLITIDLKNCKRLASLPTSICKLKSLKRLDLTGCSEFEYLPEIVEPMEDLQFLGLERTAIKELPSSIECLFGLITIQLKNCKRLASLPLNICKLKSLERLDLTGCSGFEYFPEILEPMEHLVFLSLERTSVKKLPTSLKCLSGLITIQLKNCKHLASLPTSICKLKCLDRLDLIGCSKFEYFPEILEPMEHLAFLSLERTAVTELPWSIGNLVGLQTLELCMCNNLEFVPNSIYNLNCLKTLSFAGCLRLKTLPPFLNGLCSLKDLDLSYSGILEIPDPLICLTALRDLDLSGTMIQSVPASIKQASRLFRLSLSNCKNLQSLPELPLLLSLEAHGCTSLKTVSSSTTKLTQGLDEYKFSQRWKLCVFSNCLKLDQNTLSNILNDAWLRIWRMATVPLIFEEEENERVDGFPFVSIVYPGNELPDWAGNQNEGSSTNVKLLSNSFCTDFLGCAVSVVVAFDNYTVAQDFLLGCKVTLKTNNGESYKFTFRPRCRIRGENYVGGELDDYNLNSDHVFVLYDACKSAVHSYLTEVSVDIYQMDFLRNPVNSPQVKVKKCGFCMLYTNEEGGVHVIPKLKVKVDAKTKRLRDESEASGRESFGPYMEHEDELLPQRIRKKKKILDLCID